MMRWSYIERLSLLTIFELVRGQDFSASDLKNSRRNIWNTSSPYEGTDIKA